MTATVAFYDRNDVANKNNTILDYDTTVSRPHTASAPSNPPNLPSIAPTGSLLDRKTVGAPTPGGIYQRRHTVSFSSSRFHQSQFANSLKMEPSAITDGRANNYNNNKENRFRDRSYSETGDRLKPSSAFYVGASGNSQVNSSRYKTELCRPFEENGSCKYGDKCQFAHGMGELRSLSRHPKYKTELCRTYHTSGICPYGARCHFIHNEEERRGPPLSTSNKQDRPRLQHSYSFAGFSSSGGSEDSPMSVTPPPLFHTENLQNWLANPFTYSSQELASLFGPSLGANHASDAPAPHSPTIPCLFRSMSVSPPTPLDSLSDQEGYQSSLGSQSGSESPILDATRRLPIFSRLSVSED
ncbi:mRNA decay activator protein ZFP36L1b [Chanos chanos]|uniref:mRNA decay activator protein ZFP36 n=1 Tax=Chanos chanos TaxID=29144 RepID=A0A6J2V1S3_CHACN|nr:mRNA decay activator protein ZFP36L1-like [Chanos chanos]